MLTSDRAARILALLAVPLGLLQACGGDSDTGQGQGSTTSSGGTGGQTSTGTGGATGSGGATSTGTGGATGSGGATSTGTGGATGSGGAGGATSTGTGGATGSGGAGGAGGGASFCVPGSQSSCYTGPAGTEGVGACKAGLATCQPDGTAFGACSGDVLPAADSCATPADEDCDGAAPACTGGGLWAKAFGGNYDQYGTSIAADPAGNVLVGAKFANTIDFGGGSFSAVGSPDLAVAKLDPAGNHLWSKAYIASGTDGYLNGITADENGDVYITGFFYGTTDFGGGLVAPQGGADIFLVKLDASGAFVWAKSFGDSAPQSPAAIAPRPGGGVVIVGTFSGQLTFGGNLFTSTNGSSDVFVASFDGAGNHVFSARYGDAQTQQGNGVATDAAGNVYVGATAYGSIKFGPTTLTSAGASDIAIAKLDATGAHQWSKLVGNAAGQTVDALAVDPAGDVFVTGQTSGAVDFGDGSPQSPPAAGAFYVLALDPAGGFQWVHQYANGFSPTTLRLASDGFGDALLSAGFVGTLDLGGGPMTTASNFKHDVFVLKLAPGGAHVWSKRFGDSTQQDDYQHSLGIASDPGANVLVTGYMAGVTDFGSGDVFANDPAASGDAFVAKLAP